MSNQNDKNISNADPLDIMNRSFEETKNILDLMKDGEITNIAKLSESVAKELNVPITSVQSYVRIYAKSYAGITVSPGRYGGILKGSRIKRIDRRERCDKCGTVIRKKDVDESSSEEDVD